MKLKTISEGYLDRPRQSADEIFSKIAEHALVFFDVRVSDQEPANVWSQIVSIAAVAKDLNASGRSDVGRFYEVAELEPETRAELDAQRTERDIEDTDPEQSEKRLEEITIEKMLEDAGYDYESVGAGSHPSSVLEAFAGREGFLNKYIAAYPKGVILVAYDARWQWRQLNGHLAKYSMDPLRAQRNGLLVLDIKQLVQYYFGPLFKAWASTRATNQAREMAAKFKNLKGEGGLGYADVSPDRLAQMLGDLPIDPAGLERAFPIQMPKHGMTSLDRVLAMANAAWEMLQFIKRHSDYMSQLNYKNYVDKAIQSTQKPI